MMCRLSMMALCCLLLSACSLTDWFSDRQRDQQYRTNQGALEYLNAKKAQERAR